MKHIFVTAVFLLGVVQAEALVINEVMSNPVGDDSGREWIEVYNEGGTDVDLSAMTVSIKGGTAVVTTPLQGGMTLPANGYAIIGSTVSGATKFLQDYPNYSGILFKASISLVNTGVTSIDIKLNGAAVASLPSYTAAKEGFTLSYVGGSYVTGTPTPGGDNQVADTSGSGGGSGSTSTTTEATNNQVTLPQMTPPSANIVIYMPEEKVVVAGAESDFSVFSQTREGKSINDLRYAWAFGDGGQSTGSSTKYRYAYAGRYLAQVEATSATVSGKGRMVVKVVPPDISILALGSGKYGSFVDVRNPNEYDLDLSQWSLSLNGVTYPFPINTVVPGNMTTRFSGIAMGFASTTLGTSTVAKILFPSLEEVTRYVPQETEALRAIVTTSIATATPVRVALRPQPKMVLGVSTTTVPIIATTSTKKISSRDTRLVAWIKALFGR